MFIGSTSRGNGKGNDGSSVTCLRFLVLGEVGRQLLARVRDVLGHRLGCTARTRTLSHGVVSRRERLLLLPRGGYTLCLPSERPCSR